METKFKVAKYEKLDTGFNHVGYEVYSVTYLKGKKPHLIRIVVNDVLTNRYINLIEGNSGYKNHILSAISDYKNGKISMNNVVSNKKRVTLSYIGTFYSKLIVNNVKTYLLGINKEMNRDRLTKYELI